MDTLKKIAPTPYRVDIADERLTIKRLAPEDLPEFFDIATPILDGLSSDNPMIVLVKNLRATQALLSMCSGRPLSWVEGISLKEQAKLLNAVVEANIDFFSLEVIPALNIAANGLTELLGQMQSTLLSGPDTPPIS
jgi:hypothetical protein